MTIDGKHAPALYRALKALTDGLSLRHLQMAVDRADPDEAAFALSDLETELQRIGTNVLPDARALLVKIEAES